MSPLNLFYPRSAFPSWHVLAITAILCTIASAETKEGDLFPALNAADLSSPPPAIAGKIVLIDFWASWCAPCKASFPFYAKLQTDWGADRLAVIAINVDKDATACEAFVKKLAPPFAVLRDKEQQLVRQVQVPAMPTCFLLGRDGRVRFVHRGFRGAETEREIRKEVDVLLAEK